MRFSGVAGAVLDQVAARLEGHVADFAAMGQTALGTNEMITFCNSPTIKSIDRMHF